MNKFTIGLLAASALCSAGLAVTTVPAAAQYRGDSNFSVSLGDVAFAYSDGYYDNERRWHSWRDDDERIWYEQNHGPSYYQMGRNDERDQFRRDWRDGRRDSWRNSGGDSNFSISLGNVAFGYSDGYYDNNRGWHSWRDDDERIWYQSNYRPTYYHYSRYNDRHQWRRDWRDGRRNNWRNDGEVGFSVSLGNVAFGYSDGYYDNNRRWHRWRNVNQRNWYRQHHGKTYYQMRRYRDLDRFRRDWRDGRRNDWQVVGNSNFSISLGNVVFGYSDGYYDNNRRWHTWRNDNERNWYRQNHGQTYYQLSRDRDRDRYRRDWWEGRRNDWREDGASSFSISLGNVVFGYSDGYYDNNRRWHTWRNDNERNWYQQNHGQRYFQMSRDGDRDRNRRDWRDGRRDTWSDDRVPD